MKENRAKNSVEISSGFDQQRFCIGPQEVLLLLSWFVWDMTATSHVAWEALSITNVVQYSKTINKYHLNKFTVV